MKKSRQALRMACCLAAGAVLAAAGGCSQTTRNERNAIGLYQTGNFAAAADLLKPAAQKKDENYVLNNCRYGSASLAAGRPGNPQAGILSDFDEAEHSFFEVYDLMNATKVNDPGRTAGATVVFEGVKVWTGEPFERAMAHYYLGLINLMKHDYGNARAAFQGSIFKVREYANKDKPEDYRAAESSFALGYFGLGYTNLRMGNRDLAVQNFQLAQQKDPTLARVIADVMKPGVNALIFVDSGYGPQRAAKGWYNEESAFGPTPAEVPPIAPITAWVDGRAVTQPQETYRMLDTLAMAQEQKWQDIDTIKKTKAVIGTGMMAAGTGMAAAGASGAAQHKKTNDALMVAGIATALGGAALAASSQSDVRYWEMLPRTVYIVPATIGPGQHEIVVQAGPSRSAPLVLTLPPQAPGAGGDNVFYFRLR